MFSLLELKGLSAITVEVRCQCVGNSSVIRLAGVGPWVMFITVCFSSLLGKEQSVAATILLLDFHRCFARPFNQ